jgi:peptide/nickel transport system substrate-binding protein
VRSELLQNMQRRIAEDYVNGFLFQLASPKVARAGLRGLWKDAPTQAVDLTGVYWEN